MKNLRLASLLLAVVLLFLVTLDCAHAQNPPPSGKASAELSDAEREDLTRRAHKLSQEVLRLR